MIHTTYSLKLRDYARFDETGNERFLCTVPVWIARLFYPRRIEALKENILEILSATFKTDIRKAVDRLRAYNKIIGMQAVVDGLKLHLTTKVELDMLRNKTEVDPMLTELIQYANEFFNIEIREFNDIQQLFEMLQFRIDKYHENYPKESEQKEKMSFLASAQQIFVFLEQDYNGDMSIAEFANLRKLALAKSDQIEKQLADMKNG